MNSEDVKNYCKELGATIKRFGADDAVDTDCSFLMTERIVDTRNLNPNADWFKVNFKEGEFRTGANGGLIAYRYPQNSDKIQVFGSNLEKLVDIYMSLGFELCDFYVTPDDLIVCISKSSIVNIYDCRGKKISSKYLLPEGSEDLFLSFACFYQDGCFLIYYSGDVFHLKNYNDFEIEKLPNIEQISAIRACRSFQSGDVPHPPALWIYSTDTNGDYFFVYQGDKVDRLSISIPVYDFKISYDCSLIAVMTCNPDDTSQRRLNIYDINMSECYVSINLGTKTIHSFDFCADTILLTTISNGGYELSTIGSASKNLKWEVDQMFYIVSEIDGARIIMENQIMLMRVIPQINPNNNQSLGIYEFLKADAKKSCPGMELVKLIANDRNLATQDILDKFFVSIPDPKKQSLELAVFQCLNLADFISNFRIRELLVEVAGKAKTCLENTPSYNEDNIQNVNDFFYKVIRTIRLSNNLAEPPINMPMTSSQITDLGSERLILRLCNRFHHAYAQKISEFLSCPVEIGQHWGHCLIRSNATKDKIVSLLTNKEKLDSRSTFQPQPIDYIDLAHYAFSLNRTDLGEALLELNKDKAKVVPYYIKNQNWEFALNNAVASNDEALVIHVLQEAHKMNQDQVVLEYAKKNDIAFAAYLMISDNPDPQLIIDSGKTSLATVYQFKSVMKRYDENHEYNPKELDSLIKFANDQKDRLGTSVLKAYKAYMGTYPKDLTSFDICANIAKQKEINSFAKSVEMDSSDILWSKIHKLLKDNDYNGIIQLWPQFTTSDRVSFFDMLIDEIYEEKNVEKNKNLINRLYQLVTDQSEQELISQHFNRLRYSI